MSRQTKAPTKYITYGTLWKVKSILCTGISKCKGPGGENETVVKGAGGVSVLVLRKVGIYHHPFPPPTTWPVGGLPGGERLSQDVTETG